MRIRASPFTLEAYDNEGAFLWRRDLGPNIRPGVWYSPMAVFDLDGDGRAEVVLKAGEIDESLGGDGDLNGDGITDYADDLGNVPVHEHPDTEFLEVWDGETGQTRARTAWIAGGLLPRRGHAAAPRPVREHSGRTVSRARRAAPQSSWAPLAMVSVRRARRIQGRSSGDYRIMALLVRLDSLESRRLVRNVDLE